MTITFTKHDRKLLMRRFRAADKTERSENIVTIMNFTEAYVGQQEE